jgi:viroplasmin and RNaseH domain-containing protein
VIGFKGACYKRYKTKEEAMAAFHGPKVEEKVKAEHAMVLAQPLVAKKGGDGKWKDCHFSRGCNYISPGFNNSNIAF